MLCEQQTAAWGEGTMGWTAKVTSPNTAFTHTILGVLVMQLPVGHPGLTSHPCSSQVTPDKSLVQARVVRNNCVGLFFSALVSAK